MVLIKSQSELYEIVDSIDSFHSIGKPLRDLHHLIPVTHIQDAITLWQSPTFLEARSVAWEAFRQEIVKNRSTLSQWEKEFTLCSDKVTNSISRSPKALELIRSTHQEIREFCLALPFVAALGELLILDKHPNYIFNLSQIPSYQEGYWVCGWNGVLTEDRFVYPELKFYVY
mgnify:FL=1